MTPKEQIDTLIAGLTDWRGKTLADIRQAVLEADPEITEDWKYMGSPVWSRDGAIAVGNAHKDKVKLTFSQGASLADPAGLFNNGFNGNVWRAIDIAQGEAVDLDALKYLVRAAIAFNQEKLRARAKAKRAKK